MASRRACRYKPAMRRSTLIAITLAVLLVLLGAYSAAWLVAAERVKDAVARLPQMAAAQRLEAAWLKSRVTGYPFRLRAELEAFTLRDPRAQPAPQLLVPKLTASAPLWNLRDWRLAAPYGLSAELGANEARPEVKLASHAASGAVAVADDGKTTIWLTLLDTTADAGRRIKVWLAEGWLVLPGRPPQSHAEPSLSVALDLQKIELPAPLPPFGAQIDGVAFGLTLKGAIPSGRPREAAAAWRNSGGTLELDRFRLYWGPAAIGAKGTLALDRDLQPEGAFSAEVEGYDQIVNALVQSGRMRADNSSFARLGLSMMARPGADGRSAIPTSFTIQNGQMTLGPLKLGPAPRIRWD